MNIYMEIINISIIFFNIIFFYLNINASGWVYVEDGGHQKDRINLGLILVLNVLHLILDICPICF